jgi:hypothetical protein
MMRTFPSRSCSDVILCSSRSVSAACVAIGVDDGH